MAKLYLIRRNLETFTGPLTLNEMKEAYKHMQFGLQDEVSGHCGPWISFDNLADIKKHYPEIARIVNEDMLAGWGVSDHGTRIVNEDTKRIETKSTRGIGLALTFLVIALVAFAAAIYMANGSKLSGRANSDDVTPDQIQTYIDRNDAAGFGSFMEAHVDDLVDRTIRQKKPEAQWLPYLRLFAFTRDGQVNGLPPQYLRGGSALAAPADCSLKMWRRRWRASLKDWNDFISQRKLVRADWAKILAWDPNWIRRRDNKGWLGSQNYYVGCLTMADKALGEMYADTSLVTNAADWEKIGINKIKQRLSWILEVSRDGQSGQGSAPSVDNNLSVWTCFESAKEAKDLSKCKDGQPADQDIWQAYNDERFGWNLVRIAATARGNLPANVQAQLGMLATKLGRGDHFTRFDYRAELRLLKAMTGKQGGPVEKAVEKTQSEFPDVKLTH